ncbi:MAG: divalent-cation tolerance protein CutA [Elusimicrobia bacterium]|nr:divalent-cation tolerance protein CutA [Elusimicrobiota bacterium]
MRGIVCLITVPAKKNWARKLAGQLVGLRLAACVNIIDGIESVFSWRNKVQTEKEDMLIIKTDRRLFNRLKAAVKKVHPYEVPEIIALDITRADHPYLAWIAKLVN